MELLRGSPAWEQVSALDYRAAVAALEGGKLPAAVAGKLKAYLKTEVTKSVRIVGRRERD